MAHRRVCAPDVLEEALPHLDVQQPHNLTVEYTGPLDVDKIADDVVARIHADPEFAAHVAAQLSDSDSKGQS